MTSEAEDECRRVLDENDGVELLAYLVTAAAAVWSPTTTTGPAQTPAWQPSRRR